MSNATHLLLRASCLILSVCVATGANRQWNAEGGEKIERIQSLVSRDEPQAPQIELRLYWVDKLGTRHRLSPPKEGIEVTFSNQGIDFKARYILRADAIRIPVAPQADVPKLGWGRVYQLDWNSMQAAVEVPEVAEGQMERVDVIFWEKPEDPPPVGAELPRITGTIEGLVEFIPGQLSVLYVWGPRDGRDARWARLDQDGTFMLNGVPLGGELVIFLSEELCHAYVAEVERPHIRIPADATFFPDSAQLRPITLRFLPDRLPEGDAEIAIYLSAASRLPVAVYRIPRGADQIRAKLPAGTYNVRVHAERISEWRDPETGFVGQSSETQSRTLLERLEVRPDTETIWITSRE